MGSILPGVLSFLRVGEFTIPSDSAFAPSQYFCPTDILVDSHVEPSLLRVHLKQSKTDPFHQEINIFFGCSNSNLCLVSAILSYLSLRGMHQGLLFRFSDDHLLTRDRLVFHLCKVLAKVGSGPTSLQATVFELGRQQPQRLWEWKTP